MKKNFPISWSKIQTFRKCPFQFWLQYGSKYTTGTAIIPYQENEAMRLGKIKHKLFEDGLYSLKNGYPIPVPIVENSYWQHWWAELLTNMVKAYPDFVIEQKVGIDTDGKGWPLGDYYRPPEQCTSPIKFQGAFDVTFLDKNEFLKPTFAFIADWKSGQVRIPKGRNSQTAFYALMAFLKWPSLKQITTALVFIDRKQVHQENWYRGDLPELQEAFDEDCHKIYTALETQIYEPKVGTCHWCPATQADCRNASR